MTSSIVDSTFFGADVPPMAAAALASCDMGVAIRRLNPIAMLIARMSESTAPAVISHPARCHWPTKSAAGRA